MNKKELTNLLFILLIFTFLNFFLWNSAQNKKKEAVQNTAVKTSVTPEAPQAKPTLKRVKEQTAVLETPLFQVTFSNIGGRIKSLKLKKHFQADKKTPVELIPNPDEPALSFWLKGKEYLTEAPYQIKIDPEKMTAVLTHIDPSTVITKKFSFSSVSYLVDTEISGNFNSPEGFLSWGPGLDEKVIPTGQIPPDNEGLVFKDSLLSRIRGKNFSQQEISWAGLGNKYFLVAFLPQNLKSHAIIEKKDPNKMFVSMNFPIDKKQKSYNFKIFIGPKNYDLLKNMGFGLEKAVDLGFKLIEPLSLGVLFILKAGHKIIGNYGLLIILLTIVIKIIFHPLSKKSFESTSKIQKLQPEIKKLQEKYKGQPEKIQKELAELYKTEKVNPFGGCLPILIQIPIFFALFATLSNSIELRGSSFFLWITDLSRPDTIALLGGIPINILPILMGVTMFFQQKMMPAPGPDGGMSQQMLYLMPVIMTVLFWGFPSGLVLYWLTNNVISIWEQYLFFQQQKQKK